METSFPTGPAAVLVAFLVALSAPGCAGRNDAPKPGEKKAAATKEAARYVCPMHPEQTSDRPGDCAVCGMKLVPGQTPGAAAAEGPAPSGLARIHVSEESRRQLGLTFATVEKRPSRREIRTPARIVADESRVFRMSCPADGWVDRLYVTSVGERIRKGAPVIDLYSIDGLVLFRQSLALAGRESTPEVVRERLKRWGLGDAQIDKLIKPNSGVHQVLTLAAPADGFISEKSVLLSQRVATGEPLLAITDLSSVWAEIELFESDIPWVKPGMTATITFPYWPGKEFHGKLAVLSPFLDKETRTLRARLVVPNRAFDLRPEMFGTAHIRLDLGERLVVTEGAVMRTGERNYAFRAGEGDRIDPVEVRLGARADEAWEIVSGLSAGDRVVASANFLIDSESALKAAMQAVSGK